MRERRRNGTVSWPRCPRLSAAWRACDVLESLNAVRRGASRFVLLLPLRSPIGRLEFALGNYADAERWLKLAIERSADRHLLLEFDVRCESAWLLSETNRPDEALAHLSRLREVVAEGEDWHGLGGRYELAEAAYAACVGRLADAEERFQHALDISHEHQLPWQEAKILHAWGRALANAADLSAAFSKLDASIEVYRRYGGGQPWIDLVEATRHHFTVTKTTPRQAFSVLTDREVEVLRLLVQGRSSREIGDSLALSVRTVERHISNIYLKTSTHGRAQVTSYAIANGLA